MTEEIVAELSRNDIRTIKIEDDKVQKKIENLSNHFDGVIKTLENRFNDRVDKLQRGDELLPGVMTVSYTHLTLPTKA